MQGLYWQDLFSPLFPDVTLLPSSTSTEFICETLTLQPGDELPYLFELQEGQRLEFEVASTEPIDLVVCDEVAYLGWVDSGFDPEHPVAIYTESESVRRAKLRFTAPRKGDYIVLLMNWSALQADVAVEANDQPAA